MLFRSDLYDDGIIHSFSIVVIPEWEWTEPDEIAQGFAGNDLIYDFETEIEVDAQIFYDVQLPDFRYWITWAGLPDPTPSPPVPQPFMRMEKDETFIGRVE